MFSSRAFCRSYRLTANFRTLIPKSIGTRTMATETSDSLVAEIAQATGALNDLRLQNADASSIDAAKKRLGELKKTMAAMNIASGSKDAGKKKERLLLKTAKGTRDYGAAEMFCREHVERIVKDVFTSYGGSALDTPVFERKDVLAGKYGEDQKLIFDLMDQGGEQLALRYDHTVPLARYLAMAGATVQAKIWQVGKVYRRDNPVMSKGRMREFSQADLDITGAWDPMIPDAEIISLLCTILTRLDVGEFTIKLNHRKILDGIFEVCGVPQAKIRSISSAVDKLDKLPWIEVKKEMTEEKGLPSDVADKIGEYVKHKGGPSLLDILKADATLMANPSAKQGISDMDILFTLLRAYKVLDKISFDMSLARGLDYYTGIIYEAIVEASAPPAFAANAESPAPAPSKPKSSKKAKADDGEEDELDESQVGVGSIAAGGRYDNLVGMFTAAAAAEGKKAPGLPCIGVSIGLDRIFAIVWPKWVEKGMRSKETMVYVLAAGDGLLEERIALVQELREAGIKTDFLAKKKPKLTAQFMAGEKDEVPFAVILGGDELKEGLVTIKEQKWEFVDGKKTKVQSEDQGLKVRRDGLISWIKQTPTYQGWSSGRLI
ncbi:histidyl-tRNA synthetase [Suillus tomentosus]|nr:histidyl-tRNA synthetase [Suillus tomentosus]